MDKNLVLIASLLLTMSLANAEQTRVSSLKRSADWQPKVAEIERQLADIEERLDYTEVEAELSKIKFGLDFNTSLSNFFIKNTLNQSFVEANKWSMGLNLKMDANINEYTKFTGRLSMTKAFGDITWRATSYPNSLDAGRSVGGGPSLYVERAYIDIFGSDWFAFTIGRLPGTDGPGANLRNGSVRVATYPALLVNILGDGVVFTFKDSGDIAFRMGYGKVYQPITTSAEGVTDIFSTSRARNADAQLGFATFETSFLPKSAGDSLFMLSYAGAFNYTAPNHTAANAPSNTSSIDTNYMRGDMHYINLHLESFNLYGSGFNWFVSASYYKGTNPSNYLPYSSLGITFNDKTAYAIHAGVRQDIGDSLKIGYEFFTGSKHWYSLSRVSINDPLNFRNTRGQVHDIYAIYQLDLYQLFRLSLTHQNAKYATLSTNQLNNGSKGNKISNVSLSYILRF